LCLKSSPFRHFSQANFRRPPDSVPQSIRVTWILPGARHIKAAESILLFLVLFTLKRTSANSSLVSSFESFLKMFSKVLAFGLAALTLVHAAPSLQAPILSCSVNLGTVRQTRITRS
jgi:hypothetical protein